MATSAARVVEVSFGVPCGRPSQDDALGVRVADEIAEFLNGERRSFDLTLDWGTMPPAHAAMMQYLYENVGWGQVVAYGELAMLAGFAGAARAAGSACKHCPLFPIVPVHRVIGAGGRLSGFLGRPDIKRRLLAAEGLGPFRD